MLQISDRQAAVDHWDEKDAGGRRLAGWLALTTSAFTGATVILADLVPFGVGVVPVLFLSAGSAIFCSRIWWTNPPLPEPRPEPFMLVPFTAQENRSLLTIQEPEPFRAYGACPGCGDVEAHLIREPNEDGPQWAAVIRHCSTCQREWAQR